MTILPTLLLALILILCCIGWGTVLSVLLYKKEDQIPYTIAAGLGFSVIVLIGGFLNLCQSINRTTISMVIGIGLLCLIGVIVQRIRSKDASVSMRFNIPRISAVKKQPFYVLFTGVLIGLVVIRVVSMVAPGFYNTHDDLQGYLVFPQKMIQTGSLQIDPFSERRIVSSIGGQAFVDTLILSFGDVRNAHFVDRGFGYMLYILVLFGTLKSLGIRKEYVTLLLYIPVLIMAPMANITAIYTGSVIFTLLIYWLFKKTDFQTKDLLLVAMIGAAACVLKTSFVPVVGLFVIAVITKGAIAGYKQGNKKTILIRIASRTVLMVCVLILCMLPYMVASYQSSGTFLYPLLGKGFHGSAQGVFLTPTSQISKTTILNFLYGLQNTVVYTLFALGGLWMILAYKKKKILPEVILGFIGVCGALGIGVMTAGFAISHYTFAFMMPVVIVLLASLFIAYNDRKDNVMPLHIQMSALTLVVAGILIGSGLNTFFMSEKELLGFMQSSLKASPLLSQAALEQYENLQESVPPREIILARLNDNYALNFNRNPIFIADYPGGSSLPPGMPFFKGPEVLVDYLLEKQIYFIAYSYSDQAFFTRAEYGHRLDPQMNAWIRTEAEHTFDFQDNLDVLGKSYKRVYDDGKHFVVDLRQKVQ